MKLDVFEAKQILKSKLGTVPIIRDVQIIGEMPDSFSVRVLTDSGQTLPVHAVVTDRAYPKKIAEIIQNDSAPDGYLLVMAPFVSETAEKILTDAGAGYCDFSGNCMICMHNIYISEKGHPNKFPKIDHAKTVFNPSAHTTSLILRELMADTSKAWKIKELSEAVGCSIGLVSRIKTYLCEQQWAKMDKAGLHITAPREMIHAWSTAYIPGESLNYYTLDPIPVFEEKCRSAYAKGIKICLTGFSGGVRYAPVVRYTRVHLWISRHDIPDFIDLTGCKEVESGSNVTMLITREDEQFYDCREMDGDPVASPVQVYLDCMKLAGRGEDIAEAVLEKEIIK